MRRVPRRRRSERSSLAESANDRSHSRFDRHDLVGDFLMEARGIVRLEYVLFEEPSRTYVLQEHSRKKWIFINVRATLQHFTNIGTIQTERLLRLYGKHEKLTKDTSTR